MKKLALFLVAVVILLGVNVTAHADTTYYVDGLFTMLDSTGKVMQNTSYSSSVPYYGYHTPIPDTSGDGYGGTMTMWSSPVPLGTGYQVGTGAVDSFYFFSNPIPALAKGVQILSPGSYTFNGGAFTVAPNTMGAHLLFDWGGTTNIDVVLQLDPSGTGISIYSAADDKHSGAKHTDGPFTFASMDDGSDADTIFGHPMWNGPFIGYNALFDMNIMGIVPIPEPASLLLIGSGLVGLIGIARRRNKK